MIEMIEIGTGWWLDCAHRPLGLLKVGPDSAGADPGPVCHGRGGTQPTVTDADLVLGYLDANFFLGGKMKLDLQARQAIKEQIADKLGLSIEEAAWGIHQVANESMENAARAHTLERERPASFPALCLWRGRSGACLSGGAGVGFADADCAVWGLG